MPYEVELDGPTAVGGTYRWSYKVKATPPEKLTAGEHVGLDFKKGTRLKSPSDVTPPAGSTPAEITTDDAGNPLAFATPTAAQASSGELTIDVYADSENGNTALEEVSLDLATTLTMDGKKYTSWSGRAYKVAGSTQEPSRHTKMRCPIATARRPLEEPADPTAFLAAYEGRKLAFLLEDLPAPPEREEVRIGEG